MLETLHIVLDLSIVVFIAGVLFASGLEVTFEQVLTPLKNRAFVSRALLANVVLAPLIVYAGSIVFPLERPFMIGVLLYGFASGAPYTPKAPSASPYCSRSSRFSTCRSFFPTWCQGRKSASGRSRGRSSCRCSFRS
ncbi:MAG: hypothetical protein JRJ64_02250 [Deltaproteobacteria bacterium]|nr:hypothetical protein [Deltaproteobacteria bacterium]